MKKTSTPAWWPGRCPAPGSAELDDLPWPETAPFLDPQDVDALLPSGLAVSGPPARTLAEWAAASFQKPVCVDIVIEAILANLENRLDVKLYYHHMSEMPECCSRRILAGAWNDVLTALGYRR